MSSRRLGEGQRPVHVRPEVLQVAVVVHGGAHPAGSVLVLVAAAKRHGGCN